MKIIIHPSIDTSTLLRSFRHIFNPVLCVTVSSSANGRAGDAPSEAAEWRWLLLLLLICCCRVIVAAAEIVSRLRRSARPRKIRLSYHFLEEPLIFWPPEIFNTRIVVVLFPFPFDLEILGIEILIICWCPNLSWNIANLWLKLVRKWSECIFVWSRVLVSECCYFCFKSCLFLLIFEV